MGLAGPQRAQLAGQKRPYHSIGRQDVHIRRSAPRHLTTTPWSSCRLGPRCHDDFTLGQGVYIEARFLALACLS